MKIYNYIKDLFRGVYKSEPEKLDFIRSVLDIFNPTYDRSVFETVVNGFGPMMGLVDRAEEACVSIVSSNPDLFKIQIISLTDLKLGRIIKYYAKYYGDK